MTHGRPVVISSQIGHNDRRADLTLLNEQQGRLMSTNSVTEESKSRDEDDVAGPATQEAIFRNLIRIWCLGSPNTAAAKGTGRPQRLDAPGRRAWGRMTRRHTLLAINLLPALEDPGEIAMFRGEQ